MDIVDENEQFFEAFGINHEDIFNSDEFNRKVDEIRKLKNIYRCMALAMEQGGIPLNMDTLTSIFLITVMFDEERVKAEHSEHLRDEEKAVSGFG